jgi:hypothetical protein
VGGDPGATEVVYKGVLRRWLFGWREVRVRGLASTRLQLWEVLLGRPIENRATAYAELEAYVQGPIASAQRYLKREIERQWYDRWTLKALEDEGEKVPEGGDPLVRVKHRWNPVRSSDIYEMALALAGALEGTHVADERNPLSRRLKLREN